MNSLAKLAEAQIENERLRKSMALASEYAGKAMVAAVTDNGRGLLGLLDDLCGILDRSVEAGDQ